MIFKDIRNFFGCLEQCLDTWILHTTSELRWCMNVPKQMTIFDQISFHYAVGFKWITNYSYSFRSVLKSWAQYEGSLGWGRTYEVPLSQPIGSKLTFGVRDWYCRNLRFWFSALFWITICWDMNIPQELLGLFYTVCISHDLTANPQLSLRESHVIATSPFTVAVPSLDWSHNCGS